MKPLATTMTERVRSFINKARLVSPNPNSSPDVIHIMMGPKFRKTIRADKDVDRFIFASGLGNEVRAYLKGIANGDAGEEGMSKAQADFWPDSVRKIIIAIDRARVYVPSRMEYVPLMPETISRAEIMEAGQYLKQKGAECLRVSTQLFDLHRRWKGVSHDRLDLLAQGKAR